MQALSSKAAVAQRPFAAAARLPARPAARLQVVAAKPTRAAEYRAMSAEQIDAAVQDCKREMFSMRIKFAKREEWKPSDYKALKRKVAQLLTIKREAEVAQGVDRRDSKAAENRRLVEAGLGKFTS
ncbi:50S ribosomal [Micractinium conductrix]|uniref:Large ribosomal subunit protein uL29c n=1 Tax=Micractinium conductrix TaxID=554055 RepID=A0A2P6VK29_9CHLO|nr:50S ribosomal [Micractinium conductrix]|eukprot:PSC74452.1 50S ribosomal [Micractinium conductrix]